MHRLALLSSRRVRLVISLPVIAACGVLGFIASAVHPGRTTTGASAPQSQRPVAASTVEEPPRISEHHRLAEPASPREAASLALPPLDETTLPLPSFPTPAGLVRETQGPDHVVAPAPSPPAESPPQRTGATPVKRSVSDGRHPQRMAQQRPGAPSKPSTGLKNIPLVGPVLSFFGG
jgi:hypothetical protein